MQQEKIEELQSEATRALHDQFELCKEHVEHFVDQKIQLKVEKQEILELSEDEERMLIAYRQYIYRSMPGSVFSWITPEDDKIIVTPETPSIIQDPRLVV